MFVGLMKSHRGQVGACVSERVANKQWPQCSGFISGECQQKFSPLRPYLLVVISPLDLYFQMPKFPDAQSCNRGCGVAIRLAKEILIGLADSRAMNMIGASPQNPAGHWPFGNENLMVPLSQPTLIWRSLRGISPRNCGIEI